MGEYDSPKRPLPWPLKEGLVLTRTTEDDGDCTPSSFVWPDDPDERVFIPFSLSLNEYNVLASTIDVGSDIAYGVDAIRVVWLWLRNMRCAVPICSEIIACVEDDDDTQHAIEHMLEDNDEFTEFLGDFTREHPGGIELPIDQPIPSITRLTITQPGTCDLDILWSQCVGVVSTAHVMIGQFFTAWSAYATEGNIVAAIVGNVPLLGPVAYSLGLAGVQGYAALIISSISALYSAAADDDYREQLACALFCAAQDDCYVTIGTAQSILNTRIGDLLSLLSTTDIMTSLIGLDLSGLNVADVYMAAFFDLVGQGNLVWPIVWGCDSFLASVATYNTPSNGWETACDDCPPPADNCADFTTSDGGWQALFNNPAVFATYHAGQGWGAAPDGITFGIEINLNVTINQVVVTFDQAVANVAIREFTSDGYALIQYSYASQTVHTFTGFTPNALGLGVWVDQGAYIGTAKCTEVCYATA